jgi:hypothetical protein
MRSSTNRLQTPASITAWILSFGPSDRYESAQHASAKTSASAWNSRRERTGKHGHTLGNSGGGFFPRHRFDKAHTAFRVIERRVALLRSLKSKHTVEILHNAIHSSTDVFGNGIIMLLSCLGLHPSSVFKKSY